MQEKELIDGLKQGDELAYKTLYRLHYRVLCAFAYTYVNDSFIAESLVSDVILIYGKSVKFWKSVNHFALI